MGRHKPEPGTFIRLQLADGSFGYGRLLESPYIAFYGHQTREPDSSLNRIASTPILFRIAVNVSALEEWASIGWKALEPHLTQPLVQFRQAVGDLRRCTIFDTAGNTRAAAPHECVDLERAAIWERDSAEERLLDAILGRPNASVQHLAVRLS